MQNSLRQSNNALSPAPQPVSAYGQTSYTPAPPPVQPTLPQVVDMIAGNNPLLQGFKDNVLKTSGTLERLKEREYIAATEANLKKWRSGFSQNQPLDQREGEALAHGVYNSIPNLMDAAQSLGEYTMGGQRFPQSSRGLRKKWEVDLLNEEFVPSTEWQKVISYLGESTVDPGLLAYPWYAARVVARLAKNNPVAHALLLKKFPHLRKEMIGYHGSPHKFDRFRHSQMGTGEGAQAYGWGTYIAENPNVARDYALRTTIQHGTEPALTDAGQSALIYASRKGMKGDELRDFANDAAQAYVTGQNIPEYTDVFKFMESEGVPKSGYSNLYTVDLPDSKIAQMLDWDADIPDTPEIRKLWARVYDEPFDPRTVDGARFYNDLTDAMQSQEGASMALKKHGIPGIKYFDGNSRTAGQGTRNFVVFDENDLTILTRNGESVLPKVAPTPSFKRNTPPLQQAVDFYKLHGIDVPVNQLTSAQKSELTRYGKALANPSVRRRESMILGDQQTGLKINMPNDRQVIQPSDVQDSVLVPVVGDQSVTGGTLSNIGGVPLSRDVPVQGGAHYPLERKGTGYGWASMEGAARNKQNNIINAAESTGRNPIGVYSAMGDDSINFSTPVAESMIAQLNAIGIPKKDMVALNSAIRNMKVRNPNTGKIEKPFSHFVGVDSPDVYQQILGQGDFPMEAAGKLRKGIVAEMSKAKWRNKGFPVYGDVQQAINDPRLSGVNVGDSGFSMFTANPSSGLLDSPNHLTYNKGIPGEYRGGFESPVPPEIMFPDVFDALSKKVNSAGVPFPREQQVGSLRSAQLQQIADQEWVDRVSRYLETHRVPYDKQ